MGDERKPWMRPMQYNDWFPPEPVAPVVVDPGPTEADVEDEGPRVKFKPPKPATIEPIDEHEPEAVGPPEDVPVNADAVPAWLVPPTYDDDAPAGLMDETETGPRVYGRAPIDDDAEDDEETEEYEG